mmetsp:Transcript_7166/g.15510  ORF Transcript_7166/g.15510 Transcript_7166/m.15510 type:complete len:289 (-) Transcript_7166:50-916(-)
MIRNVADERRSNRIGFLRPIIIPILVFVVLNASYFLPFAKIEYSMHVISPDDIQDNQRDGTPIPIHTERIPLDVMIYGICGEPNEVKRIHENKQFLSMSGYPRQQQNTSEIFYNNRLQMILDTKLRRIDRFLCVDGDSVNDDLQLATWVATGLIVIMLLTLGGVLSLVCTLFHAVNWIKYGRNRHRKSCVAELLAEAISWIVIFASILYVVFTWSERRSSHASFGPGCIVMLTVSSVMLCGSMRLSLGIILSKFTPAFNILFHKCQGQKENSTSPPTIVSSVADVELV